MAPRKSWEKRNTRNGEIKVPFMRFTMWGEDLTKGRKELDDGRKVRSTLPVQIILQENKKGEALFPHLSAGRRVFVQGRATFKPAIVDVKDQESGETVQKAFANYQIRMDRLVFLDAPPINQAKSDQRTLMEAGVISEDEMIRNSEALDKHYTALKGTVEGEDKAEPEKAKQNPDDPGF
jgi:hypothetical protein